MESQNARAIAEPPGLALYRIGIDHYFPHSLALAATDGNSGSDGITRGFAGWVTVHLRAARNHDVDCFVGEHHFVQSHRARVLPP
jgi:hypothetical protein